MHIAGRAFAQSLAEYAAAIAEGRIDDALHHAQHLPKYGELVAINPKFLKHFNQACPHLNAKETLSQTGELLRCVAEAMRQAQKQDHAGM